MSMQLLRPDGQQVDAAITEKKVHNLEELDREKQFAQATYERIMQKLMAAGKQVKGQPVLVRPDWPLAEQEAIDEWRAFARARNTNSTAKEPLDEDLVAKHIREGKLHAEQQARMKRNLHELHDLEEFGFKLVGAPGTPGIAQGALWMSLNCAVAYAPGGPVYVWVRTVREDIESWCSGWLPSPSRDPVIEMHDYSVEALSGLLMHLGVPGVRPLTKQQMDLCRRAPLPNALEVRAAHIPSAWYAPAALGASLVALALAVYALLLVIR